MWGDPYGRTPRCASRRLCGGSDLKREEEILKGMRPVVFPKKFQKASGLRRIDFVAFLESFLLSVMGLS